MATVPPAATCCHCNHHAPQPTPNPPTPWAGWEEMDPLQKATQLYMGKRGFLFWATKVDRATRCLSFPAAAGERSTCCCCCLWRWGPCSRRQQCVPAAPVCVTRTDTTPPMPCAVRAVVCGHPVWLLDCLPLHWSRSGPLPADQRPLHAQPVLAYAWLSAAENCKLGVIDGVP